MRFFLSSLLALLGISCSKNPESQTVPVTSVKPGPIQHAQLTDAQLERIKRLQQTFAEVDESSLETWVDNFKRDANPDKELAIWERIATAYQTYCSHHELSVEAKKEVQKVLLLRSMTSEDEVLKESKLKLLTVEDAKEVMKSY